MVTFRLAAAFLSLLLVSACGSQSSKSGTPPTSTPSVAAVVTPMPVVTPTPIAMVAGVLVGQLDQPPTIVVLKADGTVLARIPGQGMFGEHAVGAFIVVDSSGKARSVDANGVVRPVASSAVSLLAADPNSPALIVDSSTAIIGCVLTPQSCSAEAVDLGTGAVRTLFTAPPTTGQSGVMQYGPSLTILGVTADGHTVWLRDISSTSGAAGLHLSVIGVNLETGAVANHDLPDALMDDPDLAISADGKFVAGQESAGTDSTNLAIAHLHLFSLRTDLDTDLQGTAPYVRGWPPPAAPSIVFSPDGTSVTWWGGFENSDGDPRVNLATVGGTGGPLFRLTDHQPVVPMNAVYWLDQSTLLVACAGQAPYVVHTGSGQTNFLGGYAWGPTGGPTGPQTALVAVLR